jgi:hypothetical protein
LHSFATGKFLSFEEFSSLLSQNSDFKEVNARLSESNVGEGLIEFIKMGFYLEIKTYVQ